MLPAKVSYLKRCAEDELNKQNYGKAADKYAAAIALLNPSQHKAELRLLYSNISLMHCKCGRYDAALRNAAAAVQLAPGWAKGYWRQGKALEEVRRWLEALLCYLAAWQRSESGSTEMYECEQQMMVAVAQLTRQEVADMLLGFIQQQQQQQQDGASYTRQTLLLTESEQAVTTAAAAADGELAVCSNEVTIPSSSSSNDVITWQQQQQQQQQEELREAMFQIIRSDILHNASAHSKGRGKAPGYYQLLLLRCLMADGSSSSSSSSVQDDLMRIQMQILSAKVTVKLQRWQQAQAAATAAAAAIKDVVISDANQLQLLLLEAYTALGDAHMAAASSSSSSTSFTPQQTPCNPSEAAKAYLIALDLVPSSTELVTVISSDSNRSPKLPPIAAAAAAIWQQQLHSSSDRLHNQLKAKLTAAQEMLDDAQQAAVWMAAAAARPPAAAAATAGSGRQLALMQLGLLKPVAGPKEPMLLLSVTISRKSSPLPAAAAAAAVPNAAAAAAAAASLGLSGPDRVRLLSGLARLAGVGRIAVGITNVQKMLLPIQDGSSTAAGSSSSSRRSGLRSLTYTVQFGSGAAAANAFQQQCSSMSKLAAACPELRQILGAASVDDINIAAAAAADGVASVSTAAAAAIDVEALRALDDAFSITTLLENLNEPQQHKQQQQQQNACIVDCKLILHERDLANSTNEKLSKPSPSPAAAAIEDNNCAHGQQQQQQQQQQHNAFFTESQQQLVIIDKNKNQPAAAAAAAVTDITQCTYTSSSSSAAAAVAPALPLPYVHYSLVRSDGQSIERADKHPFGLTRVIHNEKDLPSDSDQIWYQPSDLPIRWRQTASETQIMLCNIPDSVISAKELNVTMEPYVITVSVRVTGEVLLDGELARGIVPEESTWILQQQTAAAATSSSNASILPTGQSQALVPTAAASARSISNALLPAATAAAPKRGEGRLVLYLAKMNLELFASPWQHSASWWPKLFADDPDQIAFDDESKDYSDLPPAVAAAHAAAAAVEEEQRQLQAARDKIRKRMQELLDSHKWRRQERLRELKAACYNRMTAAASSSGNMLAAADCTVQVVEQQA